MNRTFYVNGEFVSEADAKISVLDRGFLFADGVYEVVTILEGKLIDNAAHIARLHRSLNEINMLAPIDDSELLKVQQKLLQLNDVQQGGLYLQITRGVAERDFALPDPKTPATLVMFTQAKELLNDPKAKQGINVISLPDLRWKRRDIKTVGLLAPSLAKQKAIDAGAHDAWLVEAGYVTEGTSNNAFIVLPDGSIKTRQLGPELLSGITRAAVMMLCEQTQQHLIEQAFTIVEAQKATEAFITSASTFVLPVVKIDGVAIGDGKPGPIARRLRELYIEIALERQTFG